MNIKKLLIGGIVGGVAFFLLGWLAYGILLRDFFVNHHGLPVPKDLNRPEMLYLYLCLGNLLSGFLLSYVFIRASVKTAVSGFVTGGVIGFLVSSSVDSTMYSMTNMMSRTGVLVDVITFAVMSAITGALIVLVSGIFKTE